jgi:hypothetical protein
MRGNPVTLCRNLRNMPLFVWHSEILSGGLFGCRLGRTVCCFISPDTCAGCDLLISTRVPGSLCILSISGIASATMYAPDLLVRV